MTKHEVYIDGERYVHESETTTPAEPSVPEGYLSPHFREAEFTCNHCGSLNGLQVPQELLGVLERCRAHFGGDPTTITSGYRCPTHNANVGGAANSKHLEAIAADIQLRNTSPRRVQDYLIATYPDKYGIGRYSSFTHIDVRPEKARW